MVRGKWRSAGGLPSALKQGLGENLRIYGVQYRIVGIYETGQGLEESGGLFTLEDAQSITQKPTKVSLVQVALRRGADAAQVMRAIERLGKDLAVSKASEYEANAQWAGMVQGFAGAVGAIAIVIGGLGMMNTMVMSVLERTREIGTLRALGWARRRVMALILGEAVTLSLAGGLAGIALGIGLTSLTGRVPGYGSFMEGVLTPSLLLQGLATALGLGLVGGAYPAWVSANLLPVEALRYEGGSAGSNGGALSRVGNQSFRNLWRRRTRTLIAATGVAVGVATLAMLGSMAKGMMNEMNSLAGSGGAGNITVMQRDVADMSLSSLDEGLLPQFRAMPGVKAVSPLVLGFISTADAMFFVTVGIDPNSASMAHYKLTEGRRIRRPDEIMIGKIAARNLKLRLGSTFSLYSTRYKVVGIYETGTAWEDGGGLLLLKEAQRLLKRPRSVSFIFVDVNNPADAGAISAAIDRRFRDARAALSSEFAQSTDDMGSLQAMVDAIGLLALLVGGIVVANTMMMSIYERTREIGTLRALGWRQRAVLAQVLQEGFWLCLLAGALGSFLGLALLWLITRIPGMDALISMTWDLGATARAIVLAVVVGLIAGAYPAWRASRLRPVEALRYE